MADHRNAEKVNLVAWVEDAVEFRGDPRIEAIHRTTLEVTREPHIHGRGDCIIGVSASKACLDLKGEVKRALRDPNSVALIILKVGNRVFKIRARGHSSLPLTHESDIVVRRSLYTCPRTLAVSADKASADIPREIVRELREPSARGLLLIRAVRRLEAV